MDRNRVEYRSTSGRLAVHFVLFLLVMSYHEIYKTWTMSRHTTFHVEIESKMWYSAKISLEYCQGRTKWIVPSASGGSRAPYACWSAIGPHLQVQLCNYMHRDKGPAPSASQFNVPGDHVFASSVDRLKVRSNYSNLTLIRTLCYYNHSNQGNDKTLVARSFGTTDRVTWKDSQSWGRCYSKRKVIGHRKSYLESSLITLGYKKFKTRE